MHMFPANVGQFYGNAVPPGAAPNMPPHGFAPSPAGPVPGYPPGPVLPAHPPPPYSQQHAQAFEQRQREEEARRARLIEEEQRRRQREATRQRLMQVGRQGGVSVDALIRNIVGPTPVKPASSTVAAANPPQPQPQPQPPAPSSDDFSDFQAAAPAPTPVPTPTPAPAKPAPDLNTFMFACSDLSAPAKAKNFPRSQRPPPQPVARTATVPQSERASQWNQLSGQLDGVFVLGQQPQPHSELHNHPPHQYSHSEAPLQQQAMPDEQHLYQQQLQIQQQLQLQQQQQQQQQQHLQLQQQQHLQLQQQQQQLQLQQQQQQLQLQHQQQHPQPHPQQQHQQQQQLLQHQQQQLQLRQQQQNQQQQPQNQHLQQHLQHQQQPQQDQQPQQKQQPRFPSWSYRQEGLPLVYTQLYQAAVREGDRLDTAFLYNVFLTSGLSVEQLGQIWSFVNRTLPGQLVRPELNVALALIGIAQNSGRIELPAHFDQLEALAPLPDPVFHLSNGTRVGGTGRETSPEPAGQSPLLEPTSKAVAESAMDAQQQPAKVAQEAAGIIKEAARMMREVPAMIQESGGDGVKERRDASLDVRLTGPVQESARKSQEPQVAAAPGENGLPEADDFGDFGTFQAAPVASKSADSASDKYEALRVLSEPPEAEPSVDTEESDWGNFAAPLSEPAAAPDLLTSPGPVADAAGAADDWSNFAAAGGTPSDAWANFSTAFNSQLKIIDLTASKPPPTTTTTITTTAAAVTATAAPTAAPISASTAAAPAPTPLGPPKASRRRAKGKATDRTPHNAVRITADIELPPSEEKHDFVDAFAREDFGAILTSSSASTSEDYGEMSSQASYEATTTSSSHSSVASASPRHVAPPPPPQPQPVPLQQAPIPASAPAMVLPPRSCSAAKPPAAPDLAWRDEPPPLDCVEEDDFGDFQAGAMHGGIADDLASPVTPAPPAIALAPTFASLAPSGAASETASLEGAGSVQSLELRPAASVKSFDLDEDRPLPPPPQQQQQQQQQQPAPQTAASLMADAVQLGASDRYSSIAGDTADAWGSQFALWQRCLGAAQSKLEASCDVLIEASDACVLEEVIAVQKARAHLEALVEIYTVTRRVAAACQVFSFVRPQDAAPSDLAPLDAVWQRLADFLRLADVLPPDVSVATCAQLVSGRPEQKEQSETRLACGVCLNELSEVELSFAGRGYHPSCANFWVNCVDATLPSFAPPRLL